MRPRLFKRGRDTIKKRLVWSEEKVCKSDHFFSVESLSPVVFHITAEYCDKGPVSEAFSKNRLFSP